MKKFTGVLALFLLVSGFVMAQETVTNANCAIEWVSVGGKANIRLTNNNAKAQTVQYTIAGGKESATIDLPAKTVVTVPYAGANQNATFAIAKVTETARPKALPSGATSVAIPATTATAAPAASGPAATPAPAATTPAPAPKPAPGKK
jgi:hypothetical protein